MESEAVRHCQGIYSRTMEFATAFGLFIKDSEYHSLASKSASTNSNEGMNQNKALSRTTLHRHHSRTDSLTDEYKVALTDVQRLFITVCC